MTKLKYIPLLLLLFVLLSCKKESTVIIQAQNYNNPSDGSKYAGIHFQIIERRSSGFDNTKSKVVVDDYLDGNGRAVFNLDMKGSRSYVLGIQKPDDICYTEITIEYFLDYQQNNTINFNYLGCGYVIIPTNNINCVGPSDKLRYKYYLTNNPSIYLYRGFTGIDDVGWDENAYTPGCNSYLGIHDQIPVGNYTLEWYIERTNDTINGADTFVVNENDTTAYILNY